METFLVEEVIMQKEAPKKKYKCPYCDERYERAKLHIHIQNKHEDLIPEGYTALRVAFNTINNKTEGHCIICKGVTDWNEDKGRYERLCNNPACKEAYKKMIAERYNRIYGTDRLQTDPQYAEYVQRKALEGRKMSGKYKFEDGGEVNYMGTYEKKFLMFMDTVMHCKSEDIIAPGPSIKYMWEGKEHLYLPDYYYEPYNLIIEIKDGGSNPNTHSKRLGEEAQRIAAKEAGVKKDGHFNYVRVTNNDFGQLLQIMSVLKYQMKHPYYYTEPVFRINESVLFNEPDIYYNKDKFDSGEINLCFVTGASGSGKSTMTRGQANETTEVVELDDLSCVKDKCSYDELKKRGNLLYSYFNGIGKKFYLGIDDLKDVPVEDYEQKLFPEFINYTKNYAKSHKDKKFILEGVQLLGKFDFNLSPVFRPEDFKDYAFYIKGTSMLVSKIRAAKRDNENKEHKGFKIAKRFLLKYWKWCVLDEKLLNQYRNYFKNLMKDQKPVNESMVSEDMSGTIGAALPLTPSPVPFEAQKSNYFVVMHPQNDVFNYSITKDPLQHKLFTVDAENPGFYNVVKTDKCKISKKYLTFKIKDSQKAKELYDELEKIEEHGGWFSDDPHENYIYERLTDGSKLLDPEQILFDDRFELVRDFNAQLKEDCDNLYRWLMPTPMELLEQKMASLIESKDASTPDPDFKKGIPIPVKIIDTKSQVGKDLYNKNWEDLESQSNKVFAIAQETSTGKVAGIISVKSNKSESRNDIGGFRVFDNYKGHGIGEKLFKYAVEKLNGNRLGVYKDNEVAINLYKKYGFVQTGEKKYSDGDVVIFMERKSSTNESSVDNLIGGIYSDALEMKTALLEDWYTDGLQDYNVLPDNIDNLADLNEWKHRFYSMPHDQQRKGDDLSIDLYGDTNFNRYNKKYAKLINQISPDMDEPEVVKDTLGYITGLAEVASETEVLVSYDEWDLKMEKCRQAERDGLLIMIDTDGEKVEEYTADAIAKLKQKYAALQNMNPDKRVLSNQTASNILGLDNENLYTRILTAYLNRIDNINPKDIEDVTNREDEVVTAVQAPAPTPYYTPDNTEFVSSEKHPEDQYTAAESAQLRDLTMLLKFTSKPEKRKALKEQIFEMGWNPEIPYNVEKAKYTYLRYKDFVNIEEVDVTNLSEADEAISQAKYTSEQLKDKIVPVFVILTHNVLLRSKAIMWFTDSDYSHVSIAFDSSLDEMYTYTIGIDNAPNKKHKTGFAVDTIAKYKKFDPHMKTKIYALFVTPEQKAMMQEAVQWYIDNQDNTAYGFGTILNIVLRRPTKPKDGDKCKMVCSQFVYTILKLAEFKMKKTKDSSLVSPGDIDELSDDARFYVVFQDTIDKYDKKKVDKICYKILPTLPLEMYGINEATGVELYRPKSAIRKLDEINRVFRMAEEMLN